MANLPHQISKERCWLALTSNVQAKSPPPPPPRGTRRGVDGIAPLGFRYVAIFRKDFTFSKKPVMCSTR